MTDPRELRPLGEELRRQLRHGGPEGALADLAAAWRTAVGEEIARNSLPARVQGDGTLVVHVRDAIWGFELSQRAPEIRSRLPGAPPLQFVPGPLADAEPDPPPPPPRATREQAQEAAGWAAGIADEELRDLVARAAAASLARAAAGRPV